MSAMPIILASGLGKRYVLHHEQRERYLAIRDIISGTVKRLAQRFTYAPKCVRKSGQTENFWALKDVSFEIEEGARVGIIGRNGAGKSTLLKLLSRITEPTTGSIKLRGRVASLLEVGTGFHPELTGRENIFLNGVILGMTRAEIHRKFDDIVVFAEIERFLDTPVKRYSSGMYVRLAFAVAAHLESEILIVDEVLAVGDAQFQKKCLGRMEEIGKQGRTVLFVSHNMNAIEQLCTSALLLENGRVAQYSNDVRSVINQYLFFGNDQHTLSEWRPVNGRYSSTNLRPMSFRLETGLGGIIRGPIDNRESIVVVVEAIIENADPGLQIGFALYDADGRLLFWSFHTDGPERDWTKISPGQWAFRTALPRRLLNQGTYRLDLGAALYHRAWLVEPGTGGPSVTFTVNGGLSDSPFWMVQRPGILAPEFPWTVEQHVENGR